MSEPKIYDVILVGYGPVAEVLAVLLGRQGRSVAIFERWTERYNLPRAVCIDHEMYRMLSAIGMGEALPAVSHPGPAYRWFNADWKELLSIDWSAESISGGPEVSFVHQPTLEAMFDEQVRRQSTVEVNLGWKAIAVGQTDDRAILNVQNTATGEMREVAGRYLIGCDGANSLVRETIGGQQEDRGFEADWLVVDILPNAGVELDIPPAAQWCNPARPTTIVPAGVREGRYFRRWEFMRLPHETIADIESEEAAWRLLAPWVTPNQAVMVRHKVYTFRSLLAKRWRQGRLLIAGDAAHVMPPFMGQGMCAGLRDDWNLAWKLDLVLDGRADASLLDTYQVERAPHVSTVIDISMYLGRLICQPDPQKAAERDETFFSQTAPPPPPFPGLSAGIIDRGAPAAGLLSPHARVRRGDQEGRFDEVVGGGFVLIARNSDALDSLSTPARSAVTDIGIHQVALEGPTDDPRVVQDIEGKYEAFLDAMACDVLLIRPDYFVYGGGTKGSAASQLVLNLRQALPLRSSVDQDLTSKAMA